MTYWIKSEIRVSSSLRIYRQELTKCSVKQYPIIYRGIEKTKFIFSFESKRKVRTNSRMWYTDFWEKPAILEQLIYE